MEDLLKVKGIVVNIAGNLNTRDYLTFQQINKNVHDAHLHGYDDDRYWCEKLLRMGLKKDIELEEASGALGSLSETSEDSASIFDVVRTFSSKNAKQTYRRFYRCFHSYCVKLKQNNMAHFFPEHYDNDPVMQVKIFNYISRYNKSNYNDPQECQTIEQNLAILKEIFTNSVLQEMEDNYNLENYEAVNRFILVLLLCHEEKNAVEFFRSKAEYAGKPISFESFFNDDGVLETKLLVDTLVEMRDFLNSKIKLIDLLFEDRYPVVLQFIESFIQDTLLDFLNNLFSLNDARLNFMPVVYSLVTKSMCDEMIESKNAGPSFHEVMKEFLDMYLEPMIIKYLDMQPQAFEKETSEKFLEYKKEAAIKEKEASEYIYNSLRDQSFDEKNIVDDKNDFLSSFTRIFKLPNNERQKTEEQLQLAYNLNLITNNLQNIKTLVSLDLCYKIVKKAQDRTDQMCSFYAVENATQIVKVRCQELFKILIDQLSTNHIKPAFDKAMTLLKRYDSNEIQRVELKLEGVETQVEPLVQFTELINIGDIILQMISIFYRDELLHKNIIDKNRDFLNDVVQAKKNFENLLDDYVAEGLNIGINKLMDEVEFVFNTVQIPTDFNPDPKDRNSREIKPTQCAEKIVELLSNHSFLLTGATDKGTIDVYQQEIGERFFNEIVKHIKKNFISSDGAIFLICDLNCYYDFIAYKLKQKNIVPLFAALKNVAQLYLISGKDSKELGKMISDAGRFHGIFSQEEIYEFVERRSDWVKVKRDVEKVIYGLGVKDCTIM
ncbi:hypothetical protein HG536_0B01480 [Torulaspora globosa]|uniref:Exocyst complex component Sec10-like alpha-helical bundle domain-containing protein n=1 Tax=Torulaspora globosa TaxID=48254 RepID=A0A7G3ZCQ0_9SACH|nr:uncharacterized protein HG536_0B01480 [Torulaspora globosa]QLL31286.1 hypothetical protein HG536_0B01480 [Torulaspora globosa]